MGLFQEGWQERGLRSKFDRKFEQYYAEAYGPKLTAYMESFGENDGLSSEIYKQLKRLHKAAEFVNANEEEYPDETVHLARHKGNPELLFASAVVDARIQIEGVESRELTEKEDVERIIKQTGEWARDYVAGRSLLNRIELRLRPSLLDNRALVENSRFASKIDFGEHFLQE